MLRSAERVLSKFVVNGVKMGWGCTLTWLLFFGKVCKWLIFWGNTSLITLETTVDGHSGLWSRKNKLVSFIAVNHNRKIPAPLSRFVSVSQSGILLLSTTLNFSPRSVTAYPPHMDTNMNFGLSGVTGLRFIRQSTLASHISRQDPSKVHMIITFNLIFCACWKSLLSHWEENLTWFCWAWWLPGYFVILLVLNVCLSVHYPFSSEFNPVWVVSGSVG